MKIGEKSIGIFIVSLRENLIDMDEFNKETIFEIQNTRVHTGIPRLDELISGGLPQNSIILVSGTPGSGKTIMCYHYMQEGLNNGEKCLYLTSDERVKNILKQAGELGFNFQQYVDSGHLKFIYLDFDKSDIYREIENEIKNGGYSRVVLDSITPVSEMPVWISDGINEIIPSFDGFKATKKIPAGSIPATRMHVRSIMSILNNDNCTALVTSEIPEGSRSLSRDTISEFLVDGIILMDLDTSMDRRKLTVRKMRATKHTLKPQDIAITMGGIQFL
jgi:circadian clock protein KaiC